ncbi:MAG: hypothetical protein CSA72_05455 [Rhodobacterales bacterium]|nr:MAG: hypothetical protein CSA72_05455 [Rhodobacterales bacterium]
MALVWDALYLGVLTDGSGNTLYLDQGEGNTVSENAADIVGQTFGSSTDPLSDHVVTVTPEDTNGDGQLSTDYNAQVEYVNYDLGSGSQQVIFDTIVVYDMTITFNDGTTGQISGVVFQDWDGNAFLAPEFEDNADYQLMSSKSIRSITIDGVLTSSNANLNTDRMVNSFLCFAAGTMVETPAGPKRIESLAAGDLVQTLDHGYQPVKWVGISPVTLCPNTVEQHPVRIRAGALGENTPEQDVILSPQHRVLVQSPIAQRMVAAEEVLIPAKDLTQLDGVDRVGISEVTYVHVLFAQHEVLHTHGMASESLYPGPEALKTVGGGHRLALRKLLSSHGSAQPRPARPFMRGKKARNLIARHVKNAKPLQTSTGYSAKALSLS